MKYLLLLFVLAGCEQNLPPKYDTVRVNANYNFEYRIHKFDYEGHQYIFIEGLKQAGLEHDPNCRCKGIENDS